MTARQTPSDRRGPSDEALLASIAQGDSGALAELYDRYAAVVYALALRMLGIPEQSEDVVQETFWRVWRRSGTFQPKRGQVAGWIFGIAHNLCVDELRRQQSRPLPVYDTPERPVLRELEDNRANVAGAVLDREQRQIIRAALERIPSDQRQAIELAYFGGFSQSEIASRLQSPVGTVKTRVRLGIQKLRDMLTAQGFRPEDLSE